MIITSRYCNDYCIDVILLVLAFIYWIYLKRIYISLVSIPYILVYILERGERINPPLSHIGEMITLYIYIYILDEILC